MKRHSVRLHVPAVLLLVATFTAFGFGKETVRCQPGDSQEKIARLALPANSELVFQPVQLSLPSSPKSLVILYRFSETQERDSNYHGWVLAPVAGEPCAYEKYPISEMEEVAGFFQIQVKDVFAAEVGGKNSLVILHAYKRNGCFDDSGDAAYVYEWDGGGFRMRSDLSEDLAGIQTADGVKLAIRQLAADTVSVR